MENLYSLPPKSRMGKWRVLAFSRLHPWFGVDGGLLFHFTLSKIVLRIYLIDFEDELFNNLRWLISNLTCLCLRTGTLLYSFHPVKANQSLSSNMILLANLPALVRSRYTTLTTVSPVILIITRNGRHFPLTLPFIALKRGQTLQRLQMNNILFTADK